MAGEWIKMRCDLCEDPDVISIATACDVSEDLVVGKLHKLWSWANKHTRDGNAQGVTQAWLDRYVGLDGFLSALLDAQWVSIYDGGIRLENFDRHNGPSAKSRALAANRAKKHRSNKRNGEVTEKALPEKRREEVPPIVPPEVLSVYEYMKQIRPDIRLTDRARKHIAARLKNGFSLDDLYHAIDGWSHSEWWQANCGSFGLFDLFRSDDRTEKMIALNGQKEPTQMENAEAYREQPE